MSQSHLAWSEYCCVFVVATKQSVYTEVSLVDSQSHFVSMSRFLLKSLLQYQSLTEGEMLPTPSSSSHPPLLPVALPPGPAAAPGQSGPHSLVPLAATGEDGPLKKPKKERKERGRENGKEDSECWQSARVFIHVCEFSEFGN